MVARSLLIYIVSGFTFAAASLSRRDLVLHERRETVPTGFVQNGPAPASTLLTLRMALLSNNLSGLETALYDISTPNSPHYGQHLTKEEVEAFVAPTSHVTAAVNEFLAANNIKATTVSPAGDWLSFSILVSQANDIFDADFTVFTHEATGKQAIRTLAYSVPSSLKGQIDFIHPTVAFPVHNKQFSAVFTPKPIISITSSPNAVPSSCNTEITPDCLLALYGIPAIVNASGSQIGVSGFIDQFFQMADLETFLKEFRPDLPPPITSVFSVDNGTDPQSPSDAGIEANLDMQYTVGVAGGIPVTFISVGETNDDGINGFLDIINALLSELSPPQVLSTSYGFNEPDIPSSIANNLCNAYMQLSARGTSIIFSSGEDGVGPPGCTNFVPTFPSGCPFVTSVGMTTGITETGASSSSGGFSNIFSRPSFQSSAVQTYLTGLGSIDIGRYNRTGRGFPDICAQGENMVIVDGGDTGLVDGPGSAAIVSSIIAMLNAELLAAGKPVMGFINPFIYANPTAFNDVTTGDNPGCGTNGFPASIGWDPVTGLGTPNFGKLRTALGLQ